MSARAFELLNEIEREVRELERMCEKNPRAICEQTALRVKRDFRNRLRLALGVDDYPDPSATSGREGRKPT